MGAGTSSLVPALLADGRAVIAVDISPAALTQLRDATGDHPALSTVVADARAFVPDVPVDAWHDRAVFHFLVDEEDRAAYVRCVTAGVRHGGHLLIATFAPHGPETCSGLPVRRHDADQLTATFADGFDPVESATVDHLTPWGAVQPFTQLLLRRR
jgi:SAM-dependent methyltransferase